MRSDLSCKSNSSYLKTFIVLFFVGIGTLVISMGITICPFLGGIIAARIGVGMSAAVLAFGLKYLFHAWRGSSIVKKLIIFLLASLDLYIVGIIIWLISITVNQST